MTTSLGSIYERHHVLGKREGFSIMAAERGLLFGQLIGQGKQVLDLGCRDGTLTAYFVPGNEVLGVDVDERTLALAQTKLGIKTLVCDLNGEWSALTGKTFDVVVAGEILEHLYFPATVAAKAARVLKPDGFFIGSVPNAFSFKNRLRYLFGRKTNTPLSDPTHINQFHYRELWAILTSYFKEVEIIGLGRLAWLARAWPNACAFDLLFIAKQPKV